MSERAFRVWAPRPDRVELVVPGAEIPMTRDASGWWQASTDGDVIDYGFRVDGGDVRPDPRSPWQPNGVRGLSRIVDHDAFAWTDRAWSGLPIGDAVFYELHVGTFTPEGTFAAAAGRLPHLRSLGVTAVELMPVHEFPGRRGWGYDGVLLFAPHHAYGGPEGLKQFVDAAHGEGLAVVLDVVYNHLGPSGNHLAEFGPYFTDRYVTPWGQAVNLDGAGSDEVREFFIDNARGWIRDYHVDGLRLDAAHALIDTTAVHFVEALAEAVHALGARLHRNVFLVAETDRNDPRVVIPRSAHGYGADAQWSDDFHHAVHAVLTGERTGYYADFGTVADIANALRHVYVYDGRYSAFRHRRHGRTAGDLPGSKFLGYLQNHDQVGNRAAGERLGALVTPEKVKIGAALVLGAPFLPLLFQGEEWGASTPFLYFTDHDDPEIGRRVSEGRQAEFSAFGWRPDDVPDPQAERTFLLSKLRWDELDTEPHADLFEWYRRLLEIRRAVPALRTCDRTHVHVEFEEGKWLVLDRGEVAIAVNFGDGAERVPWSPGWARRVVLSSCDGCQVGTDELLLPPRSVAILCR